MDVCPLSLNKIRGMDISDMIKDNFFKFEIEILKLNSHFRLSGSVGFSNLQRYEFLRSVCFCYSVFKRQNTLETAVGFGNSSST
jgi:hypothetical protein